MSEQTISALLDDTLRQLIRDLNEASEPADKAHLSVAIRNLQTARNDGLTGGAGDDPLTRLAEEALNSQPTQ